MEWGARYQMETIRIQNDMHFVLLTKWYAYQLQHTWYLEMRQLFSLHGIGREGPGSWTPSCMNSPQPCHFDCISSLWRHTLHYHLLQLCIISACIQRPKISHTWNTCYCNINSKSNFWIRNLVRRSRITWQVDETTPLKMSWPHSKNRVGRFCPGHP